MAAGRRRFQIYVKCDHLDMVLETRDKIIWWAFERPKRVRRVQRDFRGSSAVPWAVDREAIENMPVFLPFSSCMTNFEVQNVG